MNERTKLLIEAVLDPQGKWYGRPWHDRRPEASLDLVPMPEEETLSIEEESEPVPWIPDKAASAYDEWEPA